MAHNSKCLEGGGRGSEVSGQPEARQRKKCGEEGEGKEKVKVSKFNFFFYWRQIHRYCLDYNAFGFFALFHFVFRNRKSEARALM